MVSTVALEIWKAYQSLDAVIPIAFVDETSGRYIDKRCADYGIIRKAGTKAKTILTISGTNGTAIAAGKVFLTEDGLEYVTDENITIASGTANVAATAVYVGTEYNVDAGSITKQSVNVSGITSVTNTAAEGGTDAETDSALVQRLYDFLQNPATSGNASHYRQWALEVDGVGAVKVIPLWDGAGTVKVLIAGSDKGPVDTEVIENCEGHIESNRPICATVTVASVEGLNINVAATITIDSSTTKAAVQEAFQKALTEYLQSIALVKYTLVYNRIAYMLLDIPGVIDYSSLTINGGTANITLDDDQVPIVGTVVVS
jgi:uncharacterized phage protein gp47/JayE